MKKIILILYLVFGTSQLSQAQIQFGINGGINYNSNSFSSVKDDVFSGAKSKTGFHAGIWSRIKIPVIGLYLRPELVYTQLNNNVIYTYTQRSNSKQISKNTFYSFQKIDIPVLLGVKILKVFTVFGGSSFQYILGSKFGISDLKEIKSDGFSLGLQLGAGIEIKKIGLDVRWERALSNTEAKFISNNIGNVNFETQVNQIIIGLSYRF